MAKANLFFIGLCFAFFLLLSGCSDVDQLQQPVDEQAIEAELNNELSGIMACYQKALLTDDPDAAGDLIKILESFDKKYNSNLSGEFAAFLAKNQSRLTSSGEDFPQLTDLPINKDGDVYLSGGANSMAGYLVDWVSPNVTAGSFNHGAVLDFDKFDPTDLGSPCFHSAGEKGAMFETASSWMSKQNVAVLSPLAALNKASLDAAQKAMDYYCDPANTNMQYGFFKDYVNFFSLVGKSDNYYWYCTKVIWRVYNSMGIDIDSNTALIDWSSSGLYSIVKSYYDVVYFWSKAKAKQALQNYINNARSTIVLAEEIYYSPHLKVYYEVVR